MLTQQLFFFVFVFSLFFFFSKRFVFVFFYKVTSHHLSLDTEAGLTHRQAGRQVDKCLRFNADILPPERFKTPPSGIHDEILQIIGKHHDTSEAKLTPAIWRGLACVLLIAHTGNT